MHKKDTQLYYLISPSGEPVNLEKQKRFFVGRAEGNNIVINDTLSSRWHLEIWWDGHNFMVQDLESSNGTLLNGEQVKSATLNDKDEIEIGLHKFIYRCVENREEVEKTHTTVILQQQKQETQQLSALNAHLPPDHDFSGTLDTVCSGDLMQMLSFSKRSGLLLLKLKLGKAMIYFHEGEVVQAEYSNQVGDDAMYEILLEDEGYFTFKKGQKPLGKNINSKLSHILLDSARRKDEERR